MAISKEQFNKGLTEVVEYISKQARLEAEKTEPWKNLFEASEKGLRPALSEANRQCNAVIINLTDIIKEKFGIKHVSRKLYNMLKALPFAMNEVTNTIEKEQGLSCCADKARYIYAEEVLAEIKFILETQNAEENHE